MAFMRLLYYDEVKYDPPNQTSYWLGGISVPDTSIPEIEELVNLISEEVFGTRVLNKETEFHGIEICRGKGNFKNREVSERLEILDQLLKVITRDDIIRIKVLIHPENLVYTNESPAQIAFMYLIEQAEKHFTDSNSLGMIFGDYDEPAIGTTVASLSKFRKGGTKWARGKEISHIIDTVHFAKSHHSRLIQLADIFLYCNQFCAKPNTANSRKPFADIMKKNNITQCSYSRSWPSEPIWYTK